MPGFGLAPADKVTAEYDFLSQTLTLHATGTVNKFMQDFFFEREIIYGGLKFSFKCWYDYAFMGEKPLDHHEKIHIPDLHAFDPELKVIIIDRNNPAGQVVPIDIILPVGILPAGSKSQTNGTSTTKPSIVTPISGPGPVVVPFQLVPDPIEMTVMYGRSFTIGTSTSFAYAVSERHDKFSLLVETAKYTKDRISWTFQPLQSGVTNVILTTESEVVIHDTPSITKAYYIINVLPEINMLPVFPPDTILSFKGRVVVAQNIVKEKYPSALLTSVDVKSPCPYPVTDPLRLSHMRCVFSVDSGMVIINSTGWGTFSPPVFFNIKGEGIGPVIFPFNIEDCIDITDAADDMQKAGITKAFFSCELSKVFIGAADAETPPYYVFAMVDGSATYVGSKDRSVKNVPTVLKALPEK